MLGLGLQCVNLGGHTQPVTPTMCPPASLNCGPLIIHTCELTPGACALGVSCKFLFPRCTAAAASSRRASVPGPSLAPAAGVLSLLAGVSEAAVNIFACVPTRLHLSLYRPQKGTWAPALRAGQTQPRCPPGTNGHLGTAAGPAAHTRAVTRLPRFCS